MRVYLVGFMGSGKSFSGRHLARRIGFGFVDLDILFEQRYRVSIPEFFRKYGETAFRTVEQRVLYETAEFSRMVISTGGGTPCYGDNMDWINRHGVSVYLKMSPSALFHRLSHSRKPRPLIKDMNHDELREYIRAKLSAREPFYQKAQLIIPGENLDMPRLVSQLGEIPGFSAFFG